MNNAHEYLPDVLRQHMQDDWRNTEMMNAEHRTETAELMENGSMLVCFSGVPSHTNEDDYYSFEENSNYYWLTGLERQKQAVVLIRSDDMMETHLFMEEPEPFMERWTGKMPTARELSERTGISVQNIHFNSQMNQLFSRWIDRCRIQTAYFDTYKYDADDSDDYNLIMAKKFASDYPGIQIRPLRFLTGALRRVKNHSETDALRHAVDITDNALKEMLKYLKPGMKEYQAQAVFEGSCYYQGAERLSFPTIAASGVNACSMHYMTNRDEIHDGDLVLFDLGAKYQNYCSDISRTYPANGVYTPRQREIYDIVLEANRAVKNAAKPGLTLLDLNRTAQMTLGKGLVRIGLIDDVSQVGKYFMHSVSHFIGIDCHDIMVGDSVLKPGSVVSDEPGLYIDEEQIGIRIEDDLLITEDGCECLSEGIMRNPDEIEAYMKEFRK